MDPIRSERAVLRGTTSEIADGCAQCSATDERALVAHSGSIPIAASSGGQFKRS
jgi:hypothetical protein